MANIIVFCKIFFAMLNIFITESIPICYQISKKKTNISVNPEGPMYNIPIVVNSHLLWNVLTVLIVTVIISLLSIIGFTI